MAQHQHIDIEGSGRYTFDVDIYAVVWNEHISYGERQLRAIVAEESGADSIRDIAQELSRFELIGMLADFETARRNLFEGKAF
ncbi:hypothetical protein TURBIDO_93 [Mycobacterium phage Turbido]|uniref:Uncharacterized protein n=3 Tax=Turbidovirus turbido TaxID=1993865 RepID=A0A1D8EZS6_9CAUD|nr:hypothetical protein TURBIDO_93 [Mycobacterium phage Turbido]AEL17775.1 hypothetical protein TURBIDO_93 [Mycobacterium phage Turbido]AOT27725.1 hypothetical protein SEA_JERM_93 [Mycobacterium phage Jerm]QWS69822.1 hypothetical protein SEA_LEVIATHAN_93 [Mycobacterium Phage Leviathan]QZD98272.1 hypothetical protein SEA_DIGNITY_94 [Mycobacterium phage Dignity]